jgi:spore coat protein U-like protein
MKPSSRWVLVAAAALSSASAVAATTTPITFTVTATVADACSVSATNLAFGAYVPASALPVDGTSTVTVTCTLAAPYNVRLNEGTASGASVTTRQMVRSGGSELLSYALYRDAARTLNWGKTDSTDTLTSIGTGLAVGHTVYGRIPASQNVPSGSYSDTITVTISY